MEIKDLFIHKFLSPLFGLILFLSNTLVLPGQDHTAAIDDIVKNYQSSFSPGISVLVSRKGDLVYHKAFGQANLELQAPLTTDHIFRIGSITKQFTAVAILKLVEEGKISLMDDIRTYIPELSPETESITIHHLLTHTSGIKNYTELESWNDATRGKHMSAKELIEVFKNEPLAFEPGNRFMYSNLGYIVLGYVIEEVSGMTYQAFLQQSFFEPLQLLSTQYDETNQLVLNRASGYSKRNDSFVNAPHQEMSLPFAAGGLISTIDDLWAWHQALLTGKVVDPKLLATAQQSTLLSDGQKSSYGYGWQIGDIRGTKTIKHDGIINGFLAMQLYVPSDDIYITLLSNCDAGNLEYPAARITALLMGRPFGPAQGITSTNALTEYVGKFKGETGDERVINVQDGQLIFHTPGGEKSNLHPIENDQFYGEKDLSTFSFIRDAKGEITSYNLQVLNDARDYSSSRISTKIDVLNPIPMSDQDMQRYIGTYHIPGAFDFEVLEQNGRLFGSVGGDKKEIKPWSRDKFYALEIDAKILFNADDANQIIGLTLVLGQEMNGEKIQ